MESSEEENDASHFLEDDIGEDKSTNINKMYIDESDPKTEHNNQYDSKNIYENPNKTTDDDKNGETVEYPNN